MSAVRRILGLSLVVSAVTAVSVTPALAATGGHAVRAATPACTDTWTNTSGGSWDTAANWNHGVPTSTDTVCITAAGSYSVIVGNETITVANLTVGASGSTPTLAIGNGGSGFPVFKVPGAVSVASTLSDGWGGSFTAGSVSVPTGGTFLVPATGYISTLSTASFDVAGSFTVNDALNFSLPTSASTLTNEATGTLTVASGKTLAITSPSGQTGTVTQKGLISNSGSLTVADATLISGGSICGNAPYVGAGDAGAGGTLTFAASVPAGPACGGSTTTDHLFVPNVTATISGTIPAAYTVSIGDSGSSEATVTLSGFSNAGTFSLGFEATITGPLTNTGTLIVPASPYVTVLNTTGIDNSGTFTVNAPLQVSLTTSSSTFTNEATGTLTVAAAVTMPIFSPSGQTGTFVQKGLITNNGSLSVAETLNISGGSICGNAVQTSAGDSQPGQVLTFAAKLAAGPKCGSLASDKLFVPNNASDHQATLNGDIPKGWTVTIGDGGSGYAFEQWTGSTINGTLVPGFGATLTDSNTVTVKGALTVPSSGYTGALNLGGLVTDKKTTISANTALTLSGSTFSNIKGAAFVVGTAVSLTTTSALSNAGGLTLDPGATLSLSGFTQTGTGTLTSQVSKAGNGALKASGSATLGGKVATKLVKFKPAAGPAPTPLITAGSISGTFAKVAGPYAISYTSTSVVATYP